MGSCIYLFNIKAAASIGENPYISAELGKHFSQDTYNDHMLMNRWANVSITATKIDSPPNLSFFIGRRIFYHSTIFMKYEPGIVSIGDWGRSDKLSNGSCGIGLTRDYKKKNYAGELNAGFREISLTASHSRPLLDQFRGSVELVLSNSSGVTISILGHQTIDKDTKFAFGVEVGQDLGMRLKLEYLLFNDLELKDLDKSLLCLF
jgi:hypothetical protein